MMSSTPDQAGTLRQMSSHQSKASSELQMPATRVISITSGKGGVGKTAVVSNVAVSLARLGKKVLIIDADLGLANVDVVLGISPPYNLNHFFSGERSLADIMVEGPHGLKILPAGSGVQQFTRLDGQLKMRLIDALDALDEHFDVVLIDTEAGISDNVTYFNVAAQDILVVTTPEPTAITDAYALMKLLSTHYHQKRFLLAVNSVRSADEGLDVFEKLTMVSGRYLDIFIDYLGAIPFDRKMHDSVRQQRVMIELYPDSKVAKSFVELAATLMEIPQNNQAQGTLQFFWKQFLGVGAEAS
ncbi:MinD/ParA family protein [Pelovirga terrestris]|uniref:MinD/ParA family protein n=1 Tax=Pelovirga terrestris TaxID=2771352 RepID=A0A8J6QX21_9BACT|nr:MinD/ParA family protein [Pelovirga terrestris]MBD1400446.1 MinD/ParA family protein [Pelovirga terrestris]